MTQPPLPVAKKANQSLRPHLWIFWDLWNPGLREPTLIFKRLVIVFFFLT